MRIAFKLAIFGDNFRPGVCVEKMCKKCETLPKLLRCNKFYLLTRAKCIFHVGFMWQIMR